MEERKRQAPSLGQNAPQLWRKATQPGAKRQTRHMSQFGNPAPASFQGDAPRVQNLWPSITIFRDISPNIVDHLSRFLRALAQKSLTTYQEYWEDAPRDLLPFYHAWMLPRPHLSTRRHFRTSSRHLYYLSGLLRRCPQSSRPLATYHDSWEHIFKYR